MVKYLQLVVFLCISFLGISQSRPDEVLIYYKSYGQSLKKVLNDLSQISGVNFAYSDAQLTEHAPIVIDANNEPLKDILHVILKKNNLTYKLIGDQLVIVSDDNNNIKEKIRIYGFIRDQLSGEPLIGVNVFLLDKSNGTTTNSRGFYSFLIENKPCRISYTYVGYQPFITDIDYGIDTQRDIYLIPDGQLNEIVIKDKNFSEENKSPSSLQFISMDVMKSANHLAGEPDLMRFLAMQHGISTASEGVGGLSVRGGSHDQNLVLLDGIPLYNSGHALGIFSVFNGNAIKSTQIYRAGIPARHHGRLSSVINIHTKDGNYNKISGDITLSTIAANATLEGPLLKDKASFLVSYRRTFLDVWIKEFSNFINTTNNQSGITNYFFNDFNAKLNFKLSTRADIQVQGFHTNDAFENNRINLDGLGDVNRRVINQANRVYSSKLNYQVSSLFFTHLTAYSTQYDFGSFRNQGFQSRRNDDTLTIFEGALFNSKLIENGFKLDNDWMVAYKHYIKFGGSWLNRTFNPSTLTFNELSHSLPSFDVTKDQANDLLNNAKFFNSEINLYIEDEFQLTDDIRINGGLVLSTLRNNSQLSQPFLQPRLSINAGGQSTDFKAGITRMAQYLHLMNNSGLGFPSDIWMPVTERAPVQTSWVFNTDFVYKLDNGLNLGFEAYYKTMNTISSQTEGAFLDVGSGEPWETNVSIGRGQAYGIDTYIEKTFGKTLFNINYSYSISDRIFSTINNGNIFPFDLNRRHSFKTSMTYRISNFSEFLFNWSFMSGTPFSRPNNQVILANGRPTVVYAARNNDLFPPFHRLDVGFSFYNVYKWGRVKFFVGVYNAYNRLNPFYTELIRSQNQADTYEFRQLSLLPLLPTISYSIAF